MSDVLTPQQRHYCMSRIRNKATKPELLVRKWLWHHGFRYRLNVTSVPGKPDIVLRIYRTAIFINGCFWHAHEGCSKFVLPKTRADWWRDKLMANRERDKCNYQILQRNGWHVIVLWQCQLIPDEFDKIMNNISVQLSRNLLNIYKI